MRLAVIPARGGSKRIPGKNIREFFGKPIIAYPIEAAIKSACFDRIIVSTDSSEIAEIARQYGAEVPFIRPAELADDFTETIPVVKHAIECLAATGGEPEEACCIYPTAPFLSPTDLQNGLKQLLGSDAEYAVSVCEYSSPIQRAIRINQHGRISMFYHENFHARSQDLEVAFHDAAQFYWGRSQAWLKELPLFGTDSLPVIIPGHRVQDIDTEEDWVRAEWLYKAMLSRQGNA